MSDMIWIGNYLIPRWVAILCSVAVASAVLAALTYVDGKLEELENE